MTGEVPKGGRWEQTEWGLPDWTDAETYHGNDYWDENRWRWEFLRRRPDYRANFEVALATIEERFDCGEDGDELALWLKGDGLRAWPFSHPSAKQYGLDVLYDPVISNWMSCGPEWNSGLVYGGFDHSEWRYAPNGKYEEVQASHMTAFTFDLRRPLVAQLEEAKKELEQYQFDYFAYGDGCPDESLHRKSCPERPSWTEAEKLALSMPGTPKMQRDKWLRYLRALDATESGASYAEIAAELLPPRTNEAGDTVPARNQKARDVVKAAKAQAMRF